jgi:hypothetical protein
MNQRIIQPNVAQVKETTVITVNYLTGSAGTFLKELRDMSNYKFLNVL